MRSGRTWRASFSLFSLMRRPMTSTRHNPHRHRRHLLSLLTQHACNQPSLLSPGHHNKKISRWFLYREVFFFLHLNLSVIAADYPISTFQCAAAGSFDLFSPSSSSSNSVERERKRRSSATPNQQEAKLDKDRETVRYVEENEKETSRPPLHRDSHPLLLLCLAKMSACVCL